VPKGRDQVVPSSFGFRVDGKLRDPFDDVRADRRAVDGDAAPIRHPRCASPWLGVNAVRITSTDAGITSEPGDADGFSRRLRTPGVVPAATLRYV
jgi:hypothetical protein